MSPAPSPSINSSHCDALESTPLRIAIVGAGIAGLAAAAALRRHGSQHIVTVYESRNAADAAAEHGTGITLAFNGIRMARALGLTAGMMPTVKGRGFRMFDRQERRLFNAPWRMPGAGPGVECDGLGNDGDSGEDKDLGDDLDGWWMLHRQDLKAALLQLATGPGEGAPVRIEYGWRVMEADPETGRLAFTNGEDVDADLIIGADGIHSEVRKTIIPPEHPKPRPTGLSTYRFCMDADAVKAAVTGRGNGDSNAVDDNNNCDDDNCKESWPPAPLAEDDNSGGGGGSSGGVFLTMVTAVDDQTQRSVVLYPCRDGALVSFACFLPDTTFRETGTGDSPCYSWTAPGSVDEMVERFVGFPDWLLRVFRRATDVKLLQICDLEPLPTYVKGRAVVIGDAAHAMVPYQGQGANQALEDVEGLGVLLEPLGCCQGTAGGGGTDSGHHQYHQRVRDKIPAMLRTWDAVRRPRATVVGLQSRAVQRRMTAETFREQAHFNWAYRGIRHALLCAAGEGASRL